MYLRAQQQSPGLPALALVSAWISTALPLRPHPRPPRGTKGRPPVFLCAHQRPVSPGLCPFVFEFSTYLYIISV